MKKLLIGIIAAMMASAASAADEVKLQLQWVTQAQFAGYYVALDKGYYKDEGLDVTILPGGPEVIAAITLKSVFDLHGVYDKMTVAKAAMTSGFTNSIQSIMS